MRLLRGKGTKICNKPVDEMSIPEIIDSFAHVDPINSKSIVNEWNLDVIARKFPKFNKGQNSKSTYWMNPNNQTSFVHGSLSHQDFIDWANGTGIAVRGNTQEEKDKYMRYADAYNKYDLSIFIYIKHLHLLDPEFKVELNYHSIYGNDRSAKKPIDAGLTRNSNDVIREMLSSYIRPSLRDIKDAVEWKRDISSISRRIDDYIGAVCETLAKCGHGYFGACNTPTELCNLAWAKDLVFAKAYSIYLEEIDPGIIECIQWCEANQDNFN